MWYQMAIKGIKAEILTDNAYFKKEGLGNSSFEINIEDLSRKEVFKRIKDYINSQFDLHKK